MKSKFLNLAYLAIGLTAFASCSSADDNPQETMIEAQNLPDKAQNFVSTYFTDKEYSKIEVNTVAEDDGSLYEVQLSGNFEIDFTAEGDWVDVDGNGQQIPTEFLPENIATYISENYADLYITGIDTEPTGYEVDLSNDLDVKFDTEGNFLSEDN